MATREDVLKYNEQYGDPLSGGVIVRGEKGEEIGRVPYADLTDDDIRNNRTMYKVDDKWTSMPKTSISLDEKTGNIKVVAPKYITQNESFKNLFADNGTLKQISRNYKLDKNYKYVDPDDETKEISASELVGRYNDEIQKYVQSTEDVRLFRDDLATTTGNRKLADALTERDLMLMRTTAIGDESDNKTLIAVPQTLNTNFYNNLRTLSGYDSKNGVISKGTLREGVYNVGKSSREDLLSARTALLAKVAEIENKEEITAEDAEEYARLTAFNAYLQKEEPEAGFWEQMGLDLEATGAGLLAAAHNVGGNLLVIGEGAANILNLITNPTLWGKPSSEWASTFQKELLEQSKQDDARIQAELEQINSGAAALMGITEMAGTIAGTLAVGKVASNAITNLASAAATTASLNSTINTLANSAALRIGAASGNLGAATLAREQIIMGASQSMTTALGGIATGSKLVNTAQNIVNLSKLNPTQLSNSVSGLLTALGNSADTARAVQVVNSAVRSVNTINKVASASTIVSQIIVDTMITNGQLLRKVVEDSTPEEAGELLKAVSFDAFIYAAGFAGGALIQKLPTTRVGRSATARAAQAEARVSTAVANAKEGIKSLVLQDASYVSNIKNAPKRQVGEAAALIRMATKNVAQAGKGLKGWEKTLDIEDNLVGLAAVQNAEDKRIAGAKSAQQRMFKADISPVLAPAYVEAVAVDQRVAALEKQYGLNRDQNNYPKTRTGKQIGIITTPSANYVNRYYRLGQIDEHYNKYKSYNPGMKDEKVFIEGYLKDFSEKYPELAKYLIDTALPTYIKLGDGMNDFKAKQQILDKDRLAGQLKSPLFARGYMHTQRIQDLDALDEGHVEIRVLERKNATIDNPESYNWGSTADYVSPTAAFLIQSMEVASIINSREMFNDYTRSNSIQRKLLFSGEEVKRANEIKKLKGDFHKNVVQSFKGVKENFAKNALGPKLGDLMVSTSDYLSKRAGVMRTGRKIARTKVGEIKITGVDKNAAFNSLSPVQINDYAVQNLGLSFTNILSEDYDAIINPSEGIKGDKTITALRREIRKSIADNADFIAGAYGIGNMEEALAILRSLPKIKTSSFKKLVGAKTLKDVDPKFKPYLSESGVDIESGDWGQWMQQYQGEFEGGGSLSTTADEVMEWYGRLIDESRASIDLYRPTYDNFLQATKFDPELPTRLDQIALKQNGFLDSKEMTDLATEMKRTFTLENLDNVYQGDIDELSNIISLGKRQRVELVSGIEDLLSEYIYTGVMGDDASRTVVNDLIANAQNKDAALEYVVLSELYDSADEFGGEIVKGIEGKVKQEITEYNAGKKAEEKIDYGKAVDKFQEVFNDVLYDRRNRAMHVLQEEGSLLVDERGIYEESRQLMKDITGAEGQKNVTIQTNLDGLPEYYETNPFVAELINYTPTTQGKSWFEMALSSKVMNLTNRIMRLSATGMNPRSIVNQTFKDSINAFTVGGTVRPAFMTEEMIVKNFGDNIAAHFEQTNRELYDQISAQAKEAGRTVGEQATRYAAATLETEISASTETQVYRSATRNKAFEVTKKAGEKVLEGFEKINDFREIGLRKAVAMENLYKYMKNGYTYDDAMRMASRAMRDATTDFLRQTYHLQAFTNTTPYLRSGINGTKSFWRAMSLDPIGIMTRLAAGVILPVVAATIAILSDDESREYYKTLYEREKTNSLIYKVNGKFMSIPLPEEVAVMVAPWRHMIESMWDGNRHAFWELAINDLVSIFPYDFTGFQDIDGITLSGDPTFFDRIKSFGMGLLADILPPVGKTAFELTYGVDPYTGKKIDKSYTYLDENYDLQVMDSTQSEFAQWLGGLTGWSPSVISSIVTNFVSTTGRDVLDSIVSLAQWVGTGGQQGSPIRLVERTISNATAPLSVTEYDRTKSVWNNNINALFDEKEGLMKVYNKYTEEINKAETSEERQAIIAKRNDYIKPFIDKVRNTVANFQSEWGGSIDTYRFAMVVSLMNFNTADATGSGTNSASRALSKEAGFDGKEEARRTIERMNIAASPDTKSILGYMYQDKNGETQVAYYTPLEIQNAQSIFYESKDIHYNNIIELIDSTDIPDSFYNAQSTVYEFTNTTDKDNARIQWNNKVFRVLLPYFQRYGVEGIMNNQDVVSYLEKYIMVPTAYKKNGKKSVYSDKLDSNLGFTKQYVIDVMTEIMK